MFFDPFSNLLVFHKDSSFVIYEEYNETRKLSKIPRSLSFDLEGHSEITSVSVHPSKQAMALQIAPTELAVLFVSANDVDEVHFKYSKANKILKHSFCFGDDFNFMTVTDRSITLYDLALSSHTPKTVK